MALLLRKKHGPGQRKEAWLQSETGGRALVWKDKGMARLKEEAMPCSEGGDRV